MPIITMIGPHAVGKTTAARRWSQRYPELRSVVADNQLEICGGVEICVRSWKSTIEDKQKIMREREYAPRRLRWLNRVVVSLC